MNEVLSLAAAFGGTLALHSTILLGLAALLELSGAVRREATRELLWRVALFGCFATAGVQVCAGITPLGGSLAAVASGVPVPPGVGTPASDGPAAGAVVGGIVPSFDLARTVTGTWLILGLLGLLHLGLSATRLRARLALRPAPADLFARVQALARDLGVRRVRVSWSDRAATPLMLGLFRWDLCIPERACAELTGPELDAVLAHELAHARGRDPGWAMATGIALRIAFWQPLVWLARRRLASLAELRCDDVARRSAPGAALCLSRALVRAAEWLRDRRTVAVPCGHAMASVPSGLAHRVHRLLAEFNPRTTAPTKAARSLIAGAFLVMPVILPSAVPVVHPVTAAVTVPVAILPPLQTLAADIGTLRAEFDEARDLVRALGLGDDATIAVLLGQIEARLLRLERRLAGLAARRVPPTSPGPSGPTLPDSGATSR